MRVAIDDEFSLPVIADSGQCFRFTAMDCGGKETVPRGEKRPEAEANPGKIYRIQAKDRVLLMRALGNGSYDVSCSRQEYDDFWVPYFSFEDNYRKIRESIDPETDPYLYACAAGLSGLRLLRQDPFETLISFIISQRKSIPGIRSAVEKLCRMAGAPFEGPETLGEAGEPRGSRTYYAFPDASAIAGCSTGELASCGLGYRTRYVKQTAGMTADGEFSLETLAGLPDEQALDCLETLPGVGVKIASCVLLFGLHRLNAFPRDVWINRVIDEQYGGRFDLSRYAPYNGIIQQYLFMGIRKENRGKRS